jgi:hypothetical protein
LEISGVICYGASDGQYARLLRREQIACRQHPFAEGLGLRPSAKMLQEFDPQNRVCIGRRAWAVLQVEPLERFTKTTGTNEFDYRRWWRTHP